MKKSFFISIFVLISVSSSVIAQIYYPFNDSDDNSDILAYWYNVPEGSVTLKKIGETFFFHSSLQIYGKAPSDSFKVNADVYDKSGGKVFSRVFDVKKTSSEKAYDIEFKQDFFKLSCPVEYLDRNPDKIVIAIMSSRTERKKEIKCRYHKLSGKISDFDGNPFKAFVSVRPDDFTFSISIWSDSSGNYEIYLPERTYSNIAVDDESYGIETTEAWAWHIIMDSDQNLDFKVGTGEVYNLNVWANNGGGNTCFISFRPMSLHLYKNINQKSSITINNKQFNLINVVPSTRSVLGGL